MRFWRNARTLLTQRGMLGDYLSYHWSQLRHGEPVRVLPSGLQIGSLSGFGEYHAIASFLSPSERRFLNEFAFEGGAMLDIGANIGIFSLSLAARFPTREIFAFEPNPVTYGALKANLARNGRANVHAYPQALAAHTGEVLFQADPVNRATTHIVPEGVPTPVGHSDSPTVCVPCLTLDAFVEAHGLDRVALLKVDVEGYEDLVLQGAETLLRSGRVKVIYYEVCPALAVQAGFRPEAASQRLQAHGYQLHSLNSQGKLQPEKVTQIAGMHLDNWVAVRP